MPSALTAQYLELARAHAAPLYGPPDVVFARGEGMWLTSVDGDKFLDCASGMGVTLLGHRHQALVRAITAQADDLLHTSNALLSPAPLQLAAALARITGGMQSFFVNSGTEATEGAMKLARAYHAQQGKPRPKFVACHNGFHGRTMGALSITGQPKLQEGFAPLLPEVAFVPFGDIDALAQAIDQETAAFVVEPLQGNGGVRLPPQGYLQRALELCHARGALMIADEIQTGMGRTGNWFLSLAEGVRCDILCIAKALGGGLPLGAVLAQKSVMQALASGSHGSTFGGNPVACRAGLALIDAVEQDDLLARARHIEARLGRMLEGIKHVKEVRKKGLLFGVECHNKASAKSLRQHCLAQKLLVTVAGPDTVRLFVPAIALDDELALVCERLEQAFVRAFAPAQGP